MSRDLEAAVHEGRVRIALERVGALLELDDDRLRAGEADRGDDLVDPRPRKVEVVNRRLIADHEAVLHARLELRHLAAVLLERDREAGPYGAVDRLRRGRRVPGEHESG